MARWLAPSAGIVGVGWAIDTAVPHAMLIPAHIVGVLGVLPLELAITLIVTLISRVALIAMSSTDQIRRDAATEVLDRLLNALTRRPLTPVPGPGEITHASSDDRIARSCREAPPPR
ncbi:MAG: hypothetical protein JO272_14650 [Pseudonocardiales bacterium]|nr:hypothetical protein [Pseudonocardiales bacterium]